MPDALEARLHMPDAFEAQLTSLPRDLPLLTLIRDFTLRLERTDCAVEKSDAVEKTDALDFGLLIRFDIDVSPERTEAWDLTADILVDLPQLLMPSAETSESLQLSLGRSWGPNLLGSNFER